LGWKDFFDSLVPFSVPSHDPYGSDLLNQRFPIGGFAYGMPRNAKIFLPFLLFIIEPLIAPLSVFTTTLLLQQLIMFQPSTTTITIVVIVLQLNI
jgi:hypothetical protein